ncbi:hypothetical protein T484DRAFT_3630648, partial [Baffinella frigidus]
PCSERREQAIARAGGIEAVLAGMGAHTSIAEVQTRGCAALANLGGNHAENKTAIARAGGIEAVAAGMVAHRSITGVQTEGCRALRNLAVNDGNGGPLGAQGP